LRRSIRDPSRVSHQIWIPKRSLKLKMLRSFVAGSSMLSCDVSRDDFFPSTSAASGCGETAGGALGKSGRIGYRRARVSAPTSQHAQTSTTADSASGGDGPFFFRVLRVLTTIRLGDQMVKGPSSPDEFLIAFAKFVVPILSWYYRSGNLRTSVHIHVSICIARTVMHAGL
jgi:hypothetical protein